MAYYLKHLSKVLTHEHHFYEGTTNVVDGVIEIPTDKGDLSHWVQGAMIRGYRIDPETGQVLGLGEAIQQYQKARGDWVEPESQPESTQPPVDGTQTTEETQPEPESVETQPDESPEEQPEASVVEDAALASDSPESTESAVDSDSAQSTGEVDSGSSEEAASEESPASEG